MFGSHLTQSRVTTLISCCWNQRGTTSHSAFCGERNFRRHNGNVAAQCVSQACLKWDAQSDLLNSSADLTSSSPANHQRSTTRIRCKLPECWNRWADYLVPNLHPGCCFYYAKAPPASLEGTKLASSNSLNPEGEIACFAANVRSICILDQTWGNLDRFQWQTRFTDTDIRNRMLYSIMHRNTSHHSQLIQLLGFCYCSVRLSEVCSVNGRHQPVWLWVVLDGWPAAAILGCIMWLATLRPSLGNGPAGCRGAYLSHGALLGMSFKEISPVAASEGFPSALANWGLLSKRPRCFFLLACFYFSKYSGTQLSMKGTLEPCLDRSPRWFPNDP